MRLQHEGIHKRIGFIIQHCGGYDREYHITKLSNEVGIDRDKIAEIFDNAYNSRLPYYIELLKKGAPASDIMKLIEYHRKMASDRVNAMMSTMGRLLQAGSYGSMSRR